MERKLDDDFPLVLYDGNETNLPLDESLITPLERYHDNHPSKEGRALEFTLTTNYHLIFILNTLANLLNPSKSLYYIKQAKHIIPPVGMRALYFALIHSHLVYILFLFKGTQA
jgi:hypothetical protein